MNSILRKAIVLFFILFYAVFVVKATHNRAGEITVQHKQGLTYTITITTYTDIIQGLAADRCALTVFFGDSTSATAPRFNGSGICNSFNGARMGENLTDNRTRKNIYQVDHTFPGNGYFKIWTEDPNRNEGILNVPGSVNIVFYLESYLLISPISGVNNSPNLLFPPIDIACLGSPFKHSPGAVDINFDSLHFKFSEPLARDGQQILNYQLPHIENGFGTLQLDPDFGIMTWDFPIKLGEYNVAIEIEEYRRNQQTNLVTKVGSVIRDMQITVTTCNDTPPRFIPQPTICVTAGELIDIVITAFDDDGDLIKLTAEGHPFLVDNPAQFPNGVQARDMVQGRFQWQTQCKNVRNQPYKVYIKAEDPSRQSLVDFLGFDIYVIAPPPENLEATPQGNTLSITWNPPSICQNIQGYDLYRRVDTTGFVPDECQIGVPSGLGYSKIAYVEGRLNNTYLDDDNGNGLLHGLLYSYLLVAVTTNGSESYASNEAYGQLRRDVPIITRASVNTTDFTQGSMTVSWSRPSELDDSVQYTGPYQYEIYRRTAGDGIFEKVGESPVSAAIETLDTVFIDLNLNTEERQFYYQIRMLNNDEYIGNTHNAASIYLNSVPSDKRITLQWDVDVPWINFQYVIYRLNETNGNFEVIDSTSNTFYVDRGLKNERPYTYFVRSYGNYSVEGLTYTLINNSQIHQQTPIDDEAPCPPKNPIINSDCNLDFVKINWEFPEDSCFQDGRTYKIYKSEFLGEPYELVSTIEDRFAIEIEYDNLTSIAGCYAITLTDSAGNESEFSNRMCADNCPVYELPNVFTPGGDGFNDFFVPFPYKHVESIDLKIYNRWGALVFETNDPNINWDGQNSEGRMISDGVYFYICDVYEKRLSGIEKRTLKGNVTVFGDGEKLERN